MSKCHIVLPLAAALAQGLMVAPAVAAEAARCEPPREGLALESVVQGAQAAPACTPVAPGQERLVDPSAMLRLAHFARGVLCWRRSSRVECSEHLYPGALMAQRAFADPPLYLRVANRQFPVARCEAPPNEAVLVADFGAIGPCLRLRIKRYETPADIGLDDPRAAAAPWRGASAPAAAPARRWLRADDKVTLFTGRGVQALVCKDEGLLGAHCQDVAAATRVSFSGLRSLWLTPDCQPGPGQVAVFARAQWRGPCRLLGAGAHAAEALSFDGQPAAALRMGPGTRVQRCTAVPQPCWPVEASAGLAADTALLRVEAAVPPPPAASNP